jgi:hypothetical protein
MTDLVACLVYAQRTCEFLNPNHAHPLFCMRIASDSPSTSGEDGQLPGSSIIYLSE